MNDIILSFSLCIATGKGGICGKRVFLASEGRSFSFNTAIVTFINHGTSVSMEKAILTLAHEFGHCFGSGHDDSAGMRVSLLKWKRKILSEDSRPLSFILVLLTSFKTYNICSVHFYIYAYL